MAEVKCVLPLDAHETDQLLLALQDLANGIMPRRFSNLADRLLKRLEKYDRERWTEAKAI